MQLNLVDAKSIKMFSIFHSFHNKIKPLVSISIHAF